MTINIEEEKIFLSKMYEFYPDYINISLIYVSDQQNLDEIIQYLHDADKQGLIHLIEYPLFNPKKPTSHSYKFCITLAGIEHLKSLTK